jgi:hypothetical protein
MKFIGNAVVSFLMSVLIPEYFKINPTSPTAQPQFSFIYFMSRIGVLVRWTFSFHDLPPSCVSKILPSYNPTEPSIEFFIEIQYVLNIVSL